MITAKNEQEVEAFLHEFKPKFSIWGIFFINRAKKQRGSSCFGYYTCCQRRNSQKNRERGLFSFNN